MEEITAHAYSAFLLVNIKKYQLLGARKEIAHLSFVNFDQSKCRVFASTSQGYLCAHAFVTIFRRILASEMVCP